MRRYYIGIQWCECYQFFGKVLGVLPEILAIVVPCSWISAQFRLQIGVSMGAGHSDLHRLVWVDKGEILWRASLAAATFSWRLLSNGAVCEGPYLKTARFVKGFIGKGKVLWRASAAFAILPSVLKVCLLRYICLTDWFVRALFFTKSMHSKPSCFVPNGNRIRHKNLCYKPVLAKSLAEKCCTSKTGVNHNRFVLSRDSTRHKTHMAISSAIYEKSCLTKNQNKVDLKS